MTITAAGIAAGALGDNTTSVANSADLSVTAGQLVVVVCSKYTTGVDAFIAADCTKSAGTATLGTIALDVQNGVNDSGTTYQYTGIWSVPVTGTGTLRMQVADALINSYLMLAVEAFNGTWDSVAANRLESSNSSTTATDDVSPATSGNVTSAGAALFVGGLAIGSAATVTITPEAAFTQIYESQNGAANETGSAIYRIVSSGTTDQTEWTASGTTTFGWAAAVALYKETNSNLSVTTGLGALTLTGNAPTAIKSGDAQAAPGVGALTVTGYAPSITNLTRQTPAIVAGDSTQSGNNTAEATWAVNFPAGVTGDLFLVNIAWDDSTDTTSVTAPSGPNGETFTSIAGPVASASTEVRLQSWYVKSTGTWGSGTRTFTPSATESWSATVIKVLAGKFLSDKPIGASSTAASAGTAETNVNSPAFSAGAKEAGGKLVAFLCADVDTISAAPGGWTAIANQDLGAVAHAVGVRDSATTASESIAAATWTITSDSWSSLAYIVLAPHVSVPFEPVAGQLTLSGATPTVQAGSGLSASPGLGQLTITGYAPTVVSPVNITTGLGALTLTGSAPTTRIPELVTTGLGALTLNGIAPTVGLTLSVTTGLGALVLTGIVPSVLATDNKQVSAGLGALTLAGFVPDVQTTAPNQVIPGTGALTITGYMPSQTLTLPAPPTGVLALTGIAPTVTQQLNVSSGLGALTLAGLAPTVNATDNKSVSAGLGALTLTGIVPGVAATDNKTATPGLGALTLAGFVPGVQITAPDQIITGLGELTITGYAPTVSVHISTGVGALTLNGLAPTVSATDHKWADAALAQLLVNCFAPGVSISTGADIQTGLGELTLNGYAPSVLGGDAISRDTGAGSNKKRRRRERYIARYKDQFHQFATLDELETFVEQAKAEQATTPKKTRAPIKISLSPQFEQEIEPVLAIPARLSAMPVGAAMAQIRMLDNKFAAILRKAADDDEEEELMMLLL